MKLTLNMNRIKYIPAVLIAIACLGLQQAKAQTATFQFTSDHVTNGAGTPPFGTVTLTQVGSNVNFDVTLTAGYQFVLTGSADSQYFKFNDSAPGASAANITAITQNNPKGTMFGDMAATPGGFNGDGTGDFSFGITAALGNGTGPSAFDGPIDFTLTNATIAQVTQPNNAGQLFVADILAPNGNTGPVDASIPEPSAMLLVPIGGILGFLLRFRLKR
jgi:hypothetical protein